MEDLVNVQKANCHKLIIKNQIAYLAVTEWLWLYTPSGIFIHYVINWVMVQITGCVNLQRKGTYSAYRFKKRFDRFENTKRKVYRLVYCHPSIYLTRRTCLLLTSLLIT